MLDSLDTLIAFVLIFTVVSMLITVVVRMISAALNLRGCNLAWGLAETFETIDKDMGQAIEDTATGFWQKLTSGLIGPLFKLRVAVKKMPAKVEPASIRHSPVASGSPTHSLMGGRTPPFAGAKTSRRDLPILKATR